MILKMLISLQTILNHILKNNFKLYLTFKMDLGLDLEKFQKMTPSERDKTIATLQQQTTLLTLQNLLVEINDKCTKKCITSPGTALSGGEKQCLERCTDRFLETYQSIMQVYGNRLQTQLNEAATTFNNGGGASGFS